MKTQRAWLMLIALPAALAPPAAQTGERSDVRGMGMARAHVAAARGLDGIGINPAVLALPDPGTITVSMLPAGLHVGSELFDYGLYTDYFTGVGTDGERAPRFLAEEDKQRILAAFHDDQPATRGDLDVRLFGASLRLHEVGTFAVAVSEQVVGVAEVSRGYAEFLLNGNTAGSEYMLDGTKAGVAWTREYTLSYAGAIPPFPFLRTLTGGATLKLVHGFGYYEIQRFDTRLSTAANGVLTGSVDFLSRSAGSMPFTSRYALFPAPVGTGWGIDLGLAGALTEELTVGLSITDIGTMQWSADLQESYADTMVVVDDPLRQEQRDALEQLVKGKKRDGSPFSTSLPTAFRLGCSLDLGELLGGVSEGLLVAADYHQGVTVGVRSTHTPRGSLGVEFRPWQWLPLRTGVSVGGTDGVNLAMGLGVELGGFDFAIASENVTWVVQPGSFSYGSLAVGMRLRF